MPKLSEGRNRPSLFNSEIPLVPIRSVLQRVAIAENDHCLRQKVPAQIAQRPLWQLQIRRAQGLGPKPAKSLPAFLRIPSRNICALRHRPIDRRKDKMELPGALRREVHGVIKKTLENRSLFQEGLVCVQDDVTEFISDRLPIGIQTIARVQWFKGQWTDRLSRRT